MLNAGTDTFGEFDLILLDEAGDVNPVTAAIFELLPGKRKVAVGDQFQNIYSFNGTVNYFETAPESAITFSMDKSFRVAEEIAGRIETFNKKYLSPTSTFRGVPIEDKTIRTTGIITRGNFALIEHIIECNNNNTPYTLVRSAKEIFSVPILLSSIKEKGFISNPKFRHLQAEVDNWASSSELKKKFKSPLTYLAELYPEDMTLQQGVRLILKHGKTKLWDTYTLALDQKKAKGGITLATAHSSKGLEFDKVIIADDLNKAVSSVIADKISGDITPEQEEILRLYYTACTRCRVQLDNAVHLEGIT